MVVRSTRFEYSNETLIIYARISSFRIHGNAIDSFQKRVDDFTEQEWMRFVLNVLESETLS